MKRMTAYGPAGWILLHMLWASLTLLPAEEFLFKYSPGEKYKIVSEVEEEVFLNGQFSHKAEILNKISVEVEDVKNGAGLLKGTFITSERRGGDMALVYELQNTYYSRFERDRTGRYDIDSEYFMPVVRDVPVFPERDLNPGDSWKERGEEVHDLRNGYGIPIPLRFPFLANYRYLGPGEYRGRVYELISVNYRVQHRTSEYFKRFSLYPVRVSGFSDQLIYWDMEKGRPHAYNEQFSIIFSLSNGDEYEFTGTARAEITESLPMDRERIAEDVEKQIQENGVQDTLVSIDERGVTIKLEDIRFAADSAELLDSELGKLERIADILRRYPDRHLLVTGHTALAGTAAGRMQLSLDRAHTVAAFFLDRGVRSPDQIVTEGKGATEPVADNSSPEGMRKNRRVEITILEN